MPVTMTPEEFRNQYTYVPSGAPPGTAAQTAAYWAKPPEAPAEVTPAAAPAPSSGIRAGNARSLYKQMGGQRGTSMDFDEFKEWYRKQTAYAGMDLSSFLSTSGMDVVTRGEKKKYGPGANFSAGSALADFANPDYLNETAQLQLLNQRTGGNYSSLKDAMNAMALGAGFAGVSQWNQNVQGLGGPKLPPELRNVSMTDIRYDPNAYRLAFNALMGAQDPAARLAAQQKLVPEWAAGVDVALQAMPDINRPGTTGIPFGFSLLADPRINVSDPTKPLFTGQYPASLNPLTGMQAGEGAFISSLSAEELMKTIYPMLYAQTHQPAGAPAPFEAGLSFGSPVLGENGLYTRSPMMGFSDVSNIDPDLARLEGIDLKPGQPQSVSQLAGPSGFGGGLYNRWQAHGYPGTPDYNPRWGGTLTGGLPDLTPEDWSLVGPGGGPVDPRIAAAIEQMQAQYWDEPLYAPWRNLDDATRQRYMALLNSSFGPGSESTLTAGYK